TNRVTRLEAQTAALDVVLLLDDRFGGDDRAAERNVALSQAIDAVEPALARLGHQSRRIALAAGIPEVISQLTGDPPDVVLQLGNPTAVAGAGDAQVTALLDLLRIPHASESPETLMLARDKAHAKLM